MLKAKGVNDGDANMSKEKGHRRLFIRKAVLYLMSMPLFDAINAAGKTKGGKRGKSFDGIYFTTGFKISELTQNQVIVWTRLCSQQKPNPVIHARERDGNNYYPVKFDDDQPVELMDGAVSGLSGKVRIKLREGKNQMVSKWHDASRESDYNVHIHMGNLKADTEYEMKLEARTSDTRKVVSLQGSFLTPPEKDRAMPVLLTTCTCQYFWNYDDENRGYRTYDSMRRLGPHFFIHTGDYVYYDRPGPLATTIEKARHKWHAMNSWPSIKEFYQDVPSYMLKDDHDLLRDDTFPDSPLLGDFSLNDGLKIWRENVSIDSKPYRTFRWGKDLQLWFVEGREFRSPKMIADYSERTIWGEEQKMWFQKTVDASDATFKILFSPTPVIGPDRDNKKDNHANQTFYSEGEWLRTYLSDIKGMFIVNGDRHWQYFSIDDKTGLREFCSGPVSDAQAGGWDENDVRPEHRFLRVKGGFLGIKIYRKNQNPTISFTHFDVDGNVVNEVIFGG
jgi:alkaline phosphatase D